MVLLRDAIQPPVLNLSQSTYAHTCCRLTASGGALAGFIVAFNSLGNAVSGPYTRGTAIARRLSQAPDIEAVVSHHP